MAEESAPAHHGISGKEKLYIAGALASIVAILLVMRNKANVAGQVISPSRSPGATGGSDALQAAVAAGNLQLQQQKLTQDAAYQQAQLQLAQAGLSTQYAIAAKQADAQTARTAIGAAGSALSPGGGLTDLIKGLFAPKTTPGTAPPTQNANNPNASAPGSAGWDRLSSFWNTITGQTASNVGPAGGYSNDPGSASQVSWLGNDNANLGNVFSNTLPYDNTNNQLNFFQGSEISYGSPTAGTADSGGDTTYNPADNPESV